MRAHPAFRRLAVGLLVAREHPRHVALFACVAGLLTGPVAPLAVVACAAAAAWVGGRASLAVLAAVAVLGGALVAQSRVAALGPGELPVLTGRVIETRAILLEPVRTRANGSAVARVRLVGRATLGAETGADAGAAPDAPGSAAIGGPRLATNQLAGEQAVARADDGRPPPVRAWAASCVSSAP